MNPFKAPIPEKSSRGPAAVVRAPATALVVVASIA
jgi:hypothetical protein